MNAWLSEGRWIDMVLILMTIEGVALVVHRLRNGRGPSAATLIANLAAGGLLLLGARLTFARAPPPWIGLSLAAAFAAHLYDVIARWRTTARNDASLAAIRNIAQ